MELKQSTMHVYVEDLERMRSLINNKRLKDVERFHEIVQRAEVSEVLNVSIDSPDFLLKDKASNDEIYRYIKLNPGASKFLYKKYVENRKTIEELCDPDNPLYLPKVKKELEISVQVRNLEGELAELKRSIDNKINERNSLIDGIAELERQYSETEEKLKKTKLDLEISETAIANLHGKEGLQKVKEYLKQIKDFITRTYEDPDNKIPSEITGNGMKARFSIDKEGLRSILDNAEKLSMYLETDRFTKEAIENSKKELMDLQEQKTKEIEQAKRELEAIQYMKPSKKLGKLATGLLDSVQFLVSKTWKSEDGIILPLIGFNQLKENLFDAQGTLGDLLRQIQKGGETDAV